MMSSTRRLEKLEVRLKYNKGIDKIKDGYDLAFFI